MKLYKTNLKEKTQIQKHIVDNFNVVESDTEVIYNPIDTKRFNTPTYSKMGMECKRKRVGELA